MDVIHLPYSITIKSRGQLVWTAKAEGLRKGWAVHLLRWVSEWKVTDNALTSKNGEPSGFITTIYKIKKKFNYELAGCNETYFQITYSLSPTFPLQLCSLGEHKSATTGAAKPAVSCPHVRRACKRFAKSLRGFCSQNETSLRPLSRPFCSPIRISKASCSCHIM